jgi:hypothetical protein
LQTQKAEMQQGSEKEKPPPINAPWHPPPQHDFPIFQKRLSDWRAEQLTGRKYMYNASAD